MEKLTCPNPHATSVEDIVKKLATNSESGLTKREVEERTKTFGKNILPQAKKNSAWIIFLSQFKHLIVFILLLAAVISYLFDHRLDTYIIFAIILINAVVGFVQEYQAEKSIDALKNLLVPETQVFRDGKLLPLSSQELVPGDIIRCDEGDTIPADARIISANNLQIDESSLTGESLPVTKNEATLPESTPMAERKNMVWMGTLVVAGECTAVVVNTASQTILGTIAKDISSVLTEDDHFKVKTNELSKQMAIIAVASAALIVIVGFFFRDFLFEEIFMFSVASLISALPEGLPVVLTVVLALSAKRMATKNAIVRRLSATETLAVADTIITDKTGTLTQNKMTITAIRFAYQPPIQVNHDDTLVSFTQEDFTPTPEHFPLQKLLDITGACHGVKREYDAAGERSFSGDPTEVALVSLADKAIASPSYYQRKMQQIKDLPFNQLNRWRASLIEFQETSNREIFAIGSPETLLEQCTTILLPDHKTHHFSEVHRSTVQDQITELTSKGMRVLAVTYREADSLETIEQEDIHTLTYVGLVGIIDPPHANAQTAIKAANAAGINVIMATGDHPLTARSIGVQLGLIPDSDDVDLVLTESDIEDISDEELTKKLTTAKIFARMTPSSKLRIAQLLQQNGHVVAMTGDGVNDAPALKQADIGIGMGKNGTDVAREASDIVLADDNFATIITAVEEGRTQLKNVRRVSIFYITTNLAESLVVVVFLLMGLPIPLLPKQILWLNIVTAGITDVALAAEPIHDGVLKNPPGKKDDKIINRRSLPTLIIATTTIGVLAFIFFVLYLSKGVDYARTMLFVVMSISQIFHMFNMRSLSKSIFTLGVFSSKNVNIACVVSFALMFAVISIPPVAKIFDFASISLVDISIAVAASLLVIVVSEVYKRYRSLFLNQIAPTTA